jgi:hypothetical protein
MLLVDAIRAATKLRLLGEQIQLLDRLALGKHAVRKVRTNAVCDWLGHFEVRV